MNLVKRFEKIPVYAIYILCFVILTAPRSVNNISGTIALILNIMKTVSAMVIFFLAVANKTKLSTFTKIFLGYFAYIIIVTMANGANLETVLKSYMLNSAMLLLFELVIQHREKKKIIKMFSDYLLLLLAVSTVQVIWYLIVGRQTEHYLLGLDNRFILYIIPALIGYVYLFKTSSTEKENKLIMTRIILVSVLGIFTTAATWSVASLVVMLVIVAGLLLTMRSRRLKLNAKILLSVMLVLSVAIVIFKVHYYLAPVITGVLHKGVSLSYRTYMWDVALGELKDSPVNAIFGFGFFDYTEVLSVLKYSAARVNHFHNLLVDIGFAGGIVGIGIYLWGLFRAAGNIDNIKDRKRRNVFAAIFAGVMLLLIFESFEAYQIYYYILALLAGYTEFSGEERRLKNGKN